MIEIVWEFQVQAGREAEFERHYGSDGTWAQLFARGTGFKGTRLLRDRETAGRYLTVDRWQDIASFDHFRAEFAAEYQRTDVAMEHVTEAEARLGLFDVA